MSLWPDDTWGGAWGHTWNGSWGLTYEAAQDEEIHAGAGHPSISAYVLPTGKRNKKRIEDSINLAMREIYEGVLDQAPQKVKKQAAKIVRPFIEKGVIPATVPPASIIDWQALERDAARVSALLKLWQEQIDALNALEDEEMLLLMLAA